MKIYETQDGRVYVFRRYWLKPWKVKIHLLEWRWAFKIGERNKRHED